MSDLENELIVEQYKALRTEIVFHLDYAVKITALGIFFLPTAFGLARQLDVRWAMYSFPLAVTALMLLVWHHQATVMVIGRYIRHFVEPLISGGSKSFEGYEDYLETFKSGRLPEMIFSYVSSFIFLVYFAVAATFSYIQIGKDFGEPNALYATIAFSILFGIVLILHMGWFPRSSGDLVRKKPSLKSLTNA